MSFVIVLQVIWKLIYFYVEAFLSIFINPKKKDVTGEIVLVTGAGHGIGREIALEFGRLGAKVVIWDINKENNDDTADIIKRNGGEAFPYVCDLSKSDNIRQVAARVKQEIGDLDILINNAGILYGGELLKMKEEHIRRTFEINTLAHFWTVQEFLPSMLEKNKGHIVTIASMSAKSGTSLLVDYSSSKYAAFGFTEALNEEIWSRYGKNVYTTTVCPMFVGTGLVKNPRLGRGKLLTPREVAMATVEGTLTNQEIVIVPPALEYQLKITQFFPRKFNVWAKRAQNIGLDPQYEADAKRD